MDSRTQWKRQWCSGNQSTDTIQRISSSTYAQQAPGLLVVSNAMMTPSNLLLWTLKLSFGTSFIFRSCTVQIVDIAEDVGVWRDLVVNGEKNSC